MSVGHALMELSPQKKYTHYLEVLTLLSSSEVLRRSSSTLKKELSRVKTRHLRNCAHAVPMLSLLLVMHPFDEQVKKLAARQEPFIDSIGFEERKICQLYHLFLRFKQTKNRFKKINMCNHIARELDCTAQWDNPHSYLPESERMLEAVKKLLKKYS